MWHDASATPAPWCYSGYAADTPVDAFGPFESFVGIWAGKSPGTGQFPSWRDFELMDFEGWWGQLSLAEVQRNPTDLKWILWGTAITSWWGADYTGKYVSEIAAVETVWQNSECEYIERLCDRRLIGYVSGTLAPQNRDYLNVRGIDLPLETDGRVSHILSAYQLLERDDDFAVGARLAFHI